MFIYTVIKPKNEFGLHCDIKKMSNNLNTKNQDNISIITNDADTLTLIKNLKKRKIHSVDFFLNSDYNS